MLYSEWEEIGGSWYYFKPSGAAVCGDWLSNEGYWYAFDSDCKMRTGWYLESGNWYYLRTAYETPSGGPKGSMLCSGTWTIGGDRIASMQAEYA